MGYKFVWLPYNTERVSIERLVSLGSPFLEKGKSLALYGNLKKGILEVEDAFFESPVRRLFKRV